MIILVAIAILVAVKDARNREIPNTLSGALALIGLLLQILRLFMQTSSCQFASLGPLINSLPTMRFVHMLPSPASCLICAFVTLGTLTAFELLIRFWRHAPGFGFGDIKYLTAWATILGIWVLFVLCLGCLLGLLWALVTRQSTFALGPWLSASAILLCCIFVAL